MNQKTHWPAFELSDSKQAESWEVSKVGFALVLSGVPCFLLFSFTSDDFVSKKNNKKEFYNIALK